ncbi:hypothetical protein ACFOWM_03615 [Ferruginibacter yonginensis]|uniref:Uncharacterized protein n=1 Tax=Ferruginibacter yonginensis TaxID=1310416 RepID=A0ABV8QQD3_9BACT
MAQQMTPAKAEEIRFCKRYSRFKVQIYFKNRAAITHYGKELANCTISQLRYGHIQVGVLNRQKGFQDCIDRIGICEKLYGKIQSAIIYDMKQQMVTEAGETLQGKIVAKYSGGAFDQLDSIVFSEEQKAIKFKLVSDGNGKEKIVRLEDFKPTPEATITQEQVAENIKKLTKKMQFQP